MLLDVALCTATTELVIAVSELVVAATTLTSRIANVQVKDGSSVKTI
jgi:hypothetical protein